jgi:hypothetical protein
MLLPSFTSTNAKVFCFRIVLTHPFMSTAPSVGSMASTAFIRGRIPVDSLVVVVLLAIRRAGPLNFDLDVF